MNISLIAFSRCVTVIRPQLARRLFHGRRGIAWTMGSILYSGLLITLLMTIDSDNFLGYNPKHGMCEFVTPPGDINGFHIIYKIAVFLPCVIIIVSYAGIHSYARRVAKNLKVASK